MKHDFYRITVVTSKRGVQEVLPDFRIRPSSDLMIRGGKFYAILNKETGFWSTDEYSVQDFVDEELYSYRDRLLKNSEPGATIVVKDLGSYRSRTWTEFKNYCSSLPDHYHQLDEKLTFSNSTVTAKDYISKKLEYPLEEGSHEAWDEIVSTLYDEEDRDKIEWAIGAVISGDSKDIQKFIVFHGEQGAGKSTILNIIEKLFHGYTASFDAKTLTSNSSAFPLEQLRKNPLVAIQHDGDLSRIEDNTKLNSIVSHEPMLMNEKNKSTYDFTPRCFLFMATNRPVKITDAKSGIIRRLIDVKPNREKRKIPRKKYDILMSRIDFELSGIAWHCLKKYQEMGKNAYNNYRPMDMIYQTDPFFNFVEYYYNEFKEEDGVTLKNAYNMWKTYCTETGVDSNRFKMHELREELKSYFKEYKDITRVDGVQVRSWYSGFETSKFESGMNPKAAANLAANEEKTFGLVLDQTESLLDILLKDCTAQYGEAKSDGGSKPKIGWTGVKTKLKDLDTKKLHFILLPKNHIVIDFDLKNDKGEKDMQRNLEAAEKWPRTYAELSQGGNGIHLHYIFDGDAEELQRLYAKDIEIKVYTGKSSLRRRLSKCNAVPVATLNCGLPRKEVGKAIDYEAVKDEKHLRAIIAKCLKKDIQQPYTTPAVSLIKKTLDDAYESGLNYDIRDLRPAILAFASKSHNQKETCMKMANDIHWSGKLQEGNGLDKPIRIRTDAEMDADHGKVSAEKVSSGMDMKTVDIPEKTGKADGDSDLVFYDIEVYPNLLLVCWKEDGEGKAVHSMTNPSKVEIEKLFDMKLVGFNCRRYDNHILYARYMGYNNEQIYRLSQRIIGGSQNCMFGNAYDISYTDVYDFAAKKQSLKKWEIELGIHHQEMGIPWDQPVPEERWKEVIGYCSNDVIATEAVFHHLAGDFQARKILAEIAGMNVNATTNQLTTRIIFQDDPEPQRLFVYPDLKKEFPGYRYEKGKSYYDHEIRFPLWPPPDEYADPPEVHKKWNECWDKWIAKIDKAYHGHIIGSFPEEGRVLVEEVIGEGGRVYANPGIYYHTKTFDVASMHPSSIIAENGFGPYTERFKQLLDIRIAIKHKDYDTAKRMLDGKLARYLTDKDQAKALSQALKIAINSVYGLTAAGFDNKFRDPRNIDNWVAKRGALFMETLRLKVQEMGGKVAHIKTDSIKVEQPTKEIEELILSYGKKWGYTFEIEDIYEKICLVNDAVYIALRDREDPGWLDECEKAKKKAEKEGHLYSEPTRWAATGAQFQHPYVFKDLFSHEEIEFRDLCETKTVTSALYLDLNENLSDVSQYEKDLEKLRKRKKQLVSQADGYLTMAEWQAAYAFNKSLPGAGNYVMNVMPEDVEKIYIELDDLNKEEKVLEQLIAAGHDYVFVGKAGSFCPVKPGCGGGILCREKDGKFYAATGSKGYRWQEGERLKMADRMDLIDMRYFESLAAEARKAIEVYGNFEEFADENEKVWMATEADILKMSDQAARMNGEPGAPPWSPPCGNSRFIYCSECPDFEEEVMQCRLGYDINNYYWTKENQYNEPVSGH